MDKVSATPTPDNLTPEERALFDAATTNHGTWSDDKVQANLSIEDARVLFAAISRERERANAAESRWRTLDALQEGLALNRDEYMERARRAEAAIQAALRPFGYRFMDPPDGGGVEIEEQLLRMEEQLLRMSQQHVSILAEVDRLRAVLARVRDSLRAECSINQPHEYCQLCTTRGPIASIDEVLG